MHYTAKSSLETMAIGKQIASSLQGGDILFLSGDLGAGKTTLTKGIAEGLGITKDVTSPTFGLMNVYDVRITNIRTLVHIDTYRLKDEKELIAIGVEDYLGNPETVCIIEWPEKIESLLARKKVKKIFLEHEGEKKRKITLKIF